MAARPTSGADLIAFLGVPTPAVTTPYDEAVDTALELVESLVYLPDGTTDTNYPATLRRAVLMQANRLHKRVGSPEGVAVFGDLGGVNITAVDKDIEQLITAYRRMDTFS
jgi:hypothetical protein